ncbi:tetratricopeptide repeat protein [soil metagenome]
MLDPRGNPASTRSAAAIDASERGLWRMMSFYGTPVADLDEAIAADPQWLLPRLMKAGFLLSLTEPSLVPEAQTLLDSADPLIAHANHRERDHLAALQTLASGDWQLACDEWQGVLQHHPRDAFALQCAHLFDFYRGDATQLRGRAQRALAHWDESDPLRPYVLGHLAFGLEECGQYAEAEDIGRQALAGEAKVPWAIHAVAHVMEMQGRFHEGSRWMSHWTPDWAQGNGFASHLGWHHALFALESLNHTEALRLFDDFLRADPAQITLNRVDAASLLWRLHLLGVDVGTRWQQLAADWNLSSTHAGFYAFNDLHALLALLGAGQIARAEAWEREVWAGADRSSGNNRETQRALGEPLMRGMLAFARGRFDEAVQRLGEVSGASQRFGGSHAQRDVIAQTQLAAAIRSTDRSVAHRLIAERQRLKPGTPLTEHWARQLSQRQAPR